MTALVGHNHAETSVLRAFRSDRMHHAWLLMGPRGVGKATFARAASGHLLTRDPDFETLAFDADYSGAGGTLLADGKHPDAHILERGPKDEKEMRKMLDGKPFEIARNIRIDQVRVLQQKLTMRASMAPRRTIIVDAVDDMEPSAANALLKTLEEPPNDTLLFLVSHNPGKLLPTIGSRCTRLIFAPLADEAMHDVLSGLATKLSERDRARLVAMSGGAPGRAMSYVEHGILELHAIMQDIAHEGDPRQLLRLKLAGLLKAKANRERMGAFVEYAPLFAARHIREYADANSRQAIAAWEELTRLASLAPTFNFASEGLAYQIGGLLARLAPPRQATHI